MQFTINMLYIARYFVQFQTGTEGFKERRTLITDRAFGPGNYTPEVSLVCFLIS